MAVLTALLFQSWLQFSQGESSTSRAHTHSDTHFLASYPSQYMYQYRTTKRRISLNRRYSRCRCYLPLLNTGNEQAGFLQNQTTTVRDIVKYSCTPLTSFLDDGGSYPECHVAQYPLEMGRKKVLNTSKQSFALTHRVDSGVFR